jgi:hypothetical protein
VTTRLALGSLPALALAPFAALLAYLVPVITVHRDDLGRTPASTPRPPDGSGSALHAGQPDQDRPLVGVPPAGPDPAL